MNGHDRALGREGNAYGREIRKIWRRKAQGQDS